MHRYRLVPLVALVGAACTVALVTGCDNDSKGSSGQTGGGQAAASAPAGDDDLPYDVRYTRCLREHGIPFESKSGTVASRVTPESMPNEAARKAVEECNKLLPDPGDLPTQDPEEAAKSAAMLKCLVERGVATFDSNHPGAITRPTNLGDPDFEKRHRAAEQECQTKLAQQR